MTTEERLHRLEMENRWLKRCALAVLVLIGAVLLMGQARSTRTVDANQFVVRDDDGRERLRMAMSPDGNARIELLDATGNLQTVIAPRLIQLYDEDGRIRTTLQNDVLYFADARSHEIAHLQGDADGTELLLASSIGDGATRLKATSASSQLVLIGNGGKVLRSEPR